MRAGCCLLNRAWYIAGRIYGVVAVLPMERLPGSGTGHYLSGVIVALGLTCIRHRPGKDRGKKKNGQPDHQAIQSKLIAHENPPYRSTPHRALTHKPIQSGLVSSHD